MLKKITGSILTIMLMTTMFLGAFGVAAPEHVYAGDGLKVSIMINQVPETFIEDASIGETISFESFRTFIYSHTHMYKNAVSFYDSSNPDAIEVSSDLMSLTIKDVGEDIKIRFIYDSSGGIRTYTFIVSQEHTHTWNNNSYSADDNVITATCQGSGTCPLANNKPKLTLSASGKTYDGTAVTATATANSNWTTYIKSTPTITYNPTNSENVGTYTASVTQGNATATKQFTISPREATLKWTNTELTYNGEAQKPTATVSNLVEGDTCDVTVTGAQTAAGDSYTAMATELSNSNYALPSSKTTNFKINKKALTLTGVTANNKVYDGNATADLNTDSKALSGIVGQDDVEIDQISGQYSDKNVGEDKEVSLEVTLKGEDAGNYVVTSGTTLEADIEARTVTVKDGIIALDKTYDGNTTATLNLSGANLDGKISGDDLGVTATGAFGDETAAEGKTVTISGHALTGSDALNYELATSGNQTTTTASINKKELKVSGVTADNKTYDGITDATIKLDNPQYDGKIAGDEVSVDLNTTTGKFEDKNVGPNKTVNVTLGLTGADAGNYIAKPATAVTADIEASMVTVSGITVDTRQYNKTTEAPLNTGNAQIDGIVAGDTVTVSGTGTYTDGADVGVGKPVMITDLTLSGADAGNYSVSAESQSAATGTVTKRDIKVSGITASDKTYDGNTDATLVLGGVALDGVLGDDDVSVDKSKIKGAFEDENVGKDKAVNITGYELTGSAKENYKLATEGQQEQTKADITPKNAEDIEPTQKEGERLTYDGTEKKPTLVVKDDETGKDLREGEDYEVEYEGVEPTEYGPIDTPPTKEGDYIAVIKFKGNYEGEPKKVKFTIYPKPNDTLLAQMTAKGKKSMVISWTKVDGADGYDIFFSKCNSKGKKYTPKLIKTVRGNSTFKFTKKKLKKRIAYKGYVRAFKMEGGKKKYISKSLMYHGFTSGYKGKYTDAKSVSVKQPNVSLSAGQTSKISASIKKVKSKKKLIKTSHAPHLRYVSSNPYVATVDGSGVITAKGNGTCYVYAVATNGVRKGVKVTVN